MIENILFLSTRRGVSGLSPVIHAGRTKREVSFHRLPNITIIITIKQLILGISPTELRPNQHIRVIIYNYSLEAFTAGSFPTFFVADFFATDFFGVSFFVVHFTSTCSRNLSLSVSIFSILA